MAADGRSLGAIGAVHYNKKTRREADGLKGTLPASARTAANFVNGRNCWRSTHVLSLGKAMKPREFVTLLGGVEGQFAGRQKTHAVAAKYFENVEKSLRRSTESYEMVRLRARFRCAMMAVSTASCSSYRHARG